MWHHQVWAPSKGSCKNLKGEQFSPKNGKKAETLINTWKGWQRVKINISIKKVDKSHWLFGWGQPMSMGTGKKNKVIKKPQTTIPKGQASLGRKGQARGEGHHPMGFKNSRIPCGVWGLWGKAAEKKKPGKKQLHRGTKNQRHHAMGPVLL